LTFPKTEDATVHDQFARAVGMVIDGKIDMCVAPASSIIYCNSRRATQQHEKIVAVAALTQKDFVGIGVLRRDGGTNIERPKDLDNKTYASSGLQFSEDLVKEMIKADGGKGEFKKVTVPYVKDIYPGLRDGLFDASCIAIPIHETLAKRDNKQLNCFCFCEYSVPHVYPAVFCVREETLRTEKKEAIRKFLRCARRGYEDLYSTDADEVARMLRDQVDHPNMKDSDFVRDSVERAKDFILTNRGGGEGGTEKGSGWGCMDLDLIKCFVEFLKEKKIIKDEVGKPIETPIDFKPWFCNELLKEE